MPISRDDARHVMIHVCLASEEQLKRAAKIKLCIAAQSPFIYWKQEPDAYLCSVLGRERTDRLNALGTMHRLRTCREATAPTDRARVQSPCTVWRAP